MGNFFLTTRLKKMFATRQIGRAITKTASNKMMGNMMRMPKPLVFSAQQSMIVPVMSKQNFSSFEMIERSTQKLNKALESEIKYENENYTQLEDIETFLNESGFVFQETDGGL